MRVPMSPKAPASSWRLYSFPRILAVRSPVAVARLYAAWRHSLHHSVILCRGIVGAELGARQFAEVTLRRLLA